MYFVTSEENIIYAKIYTISNIGKNWVLTKEKPKGYNVLNRLSKTNRIRKQEVRI